MRPFTKLALVMGFVLLVGAVTTPAAEAQRRFRGRTTVFVGGFYGYPYYGAFYDPFFFPGFYPWGPYYWQGYPPRWDGPREQTIGVRTQISPKEAQIYVDGYFRGTASDFDGLFKRLRVAPGQHEIDFRFANAVEKVHHDLYTEALKALADEGAIPSSQRDTAQTQYDAAEAARVEALRHGACCGVCCCWCPRCPPS